MKKIIILLTLSMFMLTGCFNKKSKSDELSTSDNLEITNFTSGTNNTSEDNSGIEVGTAPDGSVLITSSTLIPIDKIVTINFSEVINVDTVNTTSVHILDNKGNIIPATLSVVANHITITPNAYFLPDSRYTIVITTAVKDILGRSLAGQFYYTFPTASDLSTVPELVRVSPPDGTFAPHTTDIVMTFNEDISGDAKIILRETDTNNLVQGNSVIVGNILRFVPSHALKYSTNYTVRLQGSVNDLDGNSYIGSPIWQFSVVDEKDNDAPLLERLTPSNGEVADITTYVSMHFNEVITGDAIVVLKKSNTDTPIVGTSTKIDNTLRFIPQNNLDTGANYTVTVIGTIKDVVGNAYTGTSTWSFTTAVPVDSTAPVITLIGVNPQTLEKGSTYVELNATTDDGSSITIDSTAVDMSTVGTYQVRYNATDASNNHAVEVIRTVKVEDSTAPVITLIGVNPQTLEKGSTYVELNATTDDGSAITIDSTAVDMSTVGTYQVRYNATDASNNHAVEVIRTVKVEDSTAPVITLIGVNPQTLEKGSTYVELNATTDDGSSITIDSTAVDMSTVGTYQVRYNATDVSNNHAVEVIRTVKVIVSDTTAPILILYTPIDGAIDVNKTTNISLTFDENITDVNMTFVVKDSLGIEVNGTKLVNAGTISFMPSINLEEKEIYDVNVSGIVVDLSGNAYSVPVNWSFTVADNTAPQVILFTPENARVDVSIDTMIKVIFDENVSHVGNVIDVNDTTMGIVVSGSEGVTGNTLWFIPDSPLSEDHNYTALIYGPTYDLSGNTYTGQSVWSFTTAPIVDTTPPTVLSFIPYDGEMNVTSDSEIKVIFDENITTTGAGLKLTDDTLGTNVGASTSSSGNILRVIPDSILIEEHTYTVTMQQAPKDLSGNAYIGQMSWTFTVRPFEVSRVHNTGRLVGVYFTDKLDSTSVSASDFSIDSGAITFHSFYYFDFLKAVIFTADTDLTGNEIISVSGNITDTLGNQVNNGIPTDYPL